MHCITGFNHPKIYEARCTVSSVVLEKENMNAEIQY